MNLFQLSWKNLTFKPLSMMLSLVLFALGVGLISLLLLLNNQLQEKFDKNLAGIDLVIGAKGSPLQLILSSMYHIDAPTGNISIEEVKAFMRPGHPLIEKAIPLSLGDSHKGYRVVGASTDILKLYNATIKDGKIWDKTMEVTVGAGVAEDLNLKIGDEFHSSHGFVIDDNLIHDDAEAFKIVGVLNPTGSVIDQLILTNNQSVWAVHDHQDEPSSEEAEEEGKDEDEKQDHNHEGKGQEEHDHDTPNRPLIEEVDKDITSLLVLFKNRNFQTLNMQRSINENTNMQAATPAIEINRLYAMMGVGITLLRYLALAIIIVSGFSIFIALFSSLKERKYELALMRVMGASPVKLFLLILLEGILLAGLGYILGIILSHGSMEILAGLMKDAYRYTFSGKVFLQEEWWLLGGSLAIGMIAAIIPAIRASLTDISSTLSEG